MEKVDVIIKQRPVSVCYECDSCGNEIEEKYEDFCIENGDPPDWGCIKCPECGIKMEVDSQDWD